jgi:hypothetical protein
MSNPNQQGTVEPRGVRIQLHREDATFSIRLGDNQTESRGRNIMNNDIGKVPGPRT